MNENFEIFLVVAPGLEDALMSEVLEKGFANPQKLAGGVQFEGGWEDVWRANLELRGATRVLARVGAFRAFHLAQLDKRARKFDWATVLRPEVPVRVEAVCRKSKIYHAKAAAQRVERAITEALGAPISQEAEIVLKVRIEDDLCTFSIDTSGEALHKRGFKVAVGKAPMRENLAALFLRECGYNGSEPVLDPMCGSGTFIVEAAEIAMGLMPGRERSFAFENLASFDAKRWQKMREDHQSKAIAVTFTGFDRDSGAISNSRKNADRAGVGEYTTFTMQPISEAAPPEGPAGLVILNPPYGGRIGNKKLLYALYGTMGKVLKERFKGWRVGIITNERDLAYATGLPLEAGPVVDHGGIKVRLYKSAPLN